MSRLINDFMNADKKGRSYAFFDGDQKAAEISGKMSKAQRRKYQRYGTVPSAFYAYLRESAIINKDAKIPKGRSSVGDLLDFLRWYPYETDQARSAGEYLFREIIKADVPFLSNAFAQGDHIWKKGEFFRVPGSKAS
jgi:hypothetical protein